MFLLSDSAEMVRQELDARFLAANSTTGPTSTTTTSVATSTPYMRQETHHHQHQHTHLHQHQHSIVPGPAAPTIFTPPVVREGENLYTFNFLSGISAGAQVFQNIGVAQF